MIYTEKGTLTKLMEIVSGTSKAGKAWSAQEFVIETRDGVLVNNLHFKAFGDDVIALDGARIGDEVEVRYKPTSREYNGRWYDELKVYHVVNMTRNAPPVVKVDDAGNIVDDDLPFD